jgi:hypothetical protein
VPRKKIIVTSKQFGMYHAEWSKGKIKDGFGKYLSEQLAIPHPNNFSRKKTPKEVIIALIHHNRFDLYN